MKCQSWRYGSMALRNIWLKVFVLLCLQSNVHAQFWRKGPTQIYDDKKQLILQYNLLDWKLDGEYCAYYQNGNLATKGHFKDNLREGEWYEYHPNGQIALQCTFSEGKRDGPLTCWWPNGQMAVEAYYSIEVRRDWLHRKYSNRHGKWTYWNEKGELRKEFIAWFQDNPDSLPEIPLANDFYDISTHLNKHATYPMDFARPHFSQGPISAFFYVEDGEGGNRLEWLFNRGSGDFQSFNVYNGDTIGLIAAYELKSYYHEGGGLDMGLAYEIYALNTPDGPRGKWRINDVYLMFDKKGQLLKRRRVVRNGYESMTLEGLEQIQIEDRKWKNEQGILIEQNTDTIWVTSKPRYFEDFTIPIASSTAPVNGPPSGKIVFRPSMHWRSIYSLNNLDTTFLCDFDKLRLTQYIEDHRYLPETKMYDSSVFVGEGGVLPVIIYFDKVRVCLYEYGTWQWRNSGIDSIVLVEGPYRDYNPLPLPGKYKSVFGMCTSSTAYTPVSTARSGQWKYFDKKGQLVARLTFHKGQVVDYELFQK